MDYRDSPAVNYSTLKHLRPPDGSPLHYRYALDNPKEVTTAMLLGRLTHSAVFEPDLLLEEYAVWDGDRRGKEYHMFLELHEDRGQTVIKRNDWHEAVAIRDAVRSVPAVAELLSRGKAEVKMHWTNPNTGIDCKGRADWVGSDNIGPYILDLKTTGTGISPRRFASSAWAAGYWMQAAMYQEGYAIMNDGMVPRMGFIAAESKPPYAVRLYWLTPPGLISGWDEFVRCLRTVQDCTASGEWPGPDAVAELDAPAWAVVEEEIDFSGIGGE